MRRCLIFGICSVFLWAGAAQAAPLKYHGTTVSQLGTGPKTIFQGTGVATVNNSTGYGHLNVFQAFDDITGQQSNPVTDPEVTVDGIISVILTLTGGGGTLGNISGGGVLNPGKFAAHGLSRTCLYDPNCLPGGFLPLPLNQTKHLTTSSSITVGVGVGGVQTIGATGMIRISIVNNPYTLGVASAVDQTDNGGFTLRRVTGFAHGPASLTSSTAKPSGVVQFVSPSQLSTNLTAGSAELISLLNQIRIHFIPEPGLLLLLGSGVAGLVLMGLARKRR